MSDAGERLLRDAALVASRLREMDADATRALLAFGGDVHACAASLFGAWSLGLVPVLANHSGRAAVAPVLQREGSRTFVHDTPTGLGQRVPDLFVDAATEPLDELAFGALHTCPSGEHPVKEWTRGDWLAWVDRAGEAHGMQDVAVATTLAPSSLAAVSLAICAPLRVGGSLAPRWTVTPGGFAAQLRRGTPESAGARVLVASPPHLRPLVRLEPAALEGITRVVCTGSAPDPWLRDQLARHDVQVAVEWAGEVDPAIAEAEAVLLAEERVEDGAVLRVGDELWAAATAAVPAPALAGGPWSQLRWMENIPRDPNGALDTVALYRRFGRDEAGGPVTVGVVWGGATERLDGDSGEKIVRESVSIPADSRWFEGHFRGHPLFPGAAQLQDLVLPLLHRVTPGYRVAEWRGVKFVEGIRPGDTVQVSVEFAEAIADGSGAKFTIHNGDVRCTMGSMRIVTEGSS